MRYIIETYGCQMNVAESNAIELLLLARGAEKAESTNDADVVILNTCSVRKTAENRIWGRLGFYSTVKKRNKKFRIILTGCMAERLKDEIKKDAPYVDAVIGTNEKNEIASFVMDNELEKEEKYSFLPSYYKEGDISSYIPIMNGCNNFCSYCIVPYVRGREVSRSVEEILSEIDFLEKKGVKEVTLLGQNVNSYKSTYNGKTVDFPSLLELIIPHLENILFIRFESPHPKDFSDHLISVIAENKKIAKHIHLPMQSGSTRILSLMNRKTTREAFIALVEKMYEKIPTLTLSTDVMTGFPSETEEEFEETLSMMDVMKCTEAFMYYYNPREGTKAYSMPGQIDEKEKIRRLEILIKEQLERAKNIKSARLPFKSDAIVLSVTRDEKERLLAKTEHNDMISFLPEKEHKSGDVVTLYVTELNGNTFRGEEIV